MSLGREFAGAMAAKDHGRLRELVHSEVDFRGMTPGGLFESMSVDGFLSAVGKWFDEEDKIESVEKLEADAFGGVERIGYRVRVRNGDGMNVVEQQAYYQVNEGQITWLRVMCSGYWPVPE